MTIRNFITEVVSPSPQKNAWVGRLRRLDDRILMHGDEEIDWGNFTVPLTDVSMIHLLKQFRIGYRMIGWLDRETNGEIQ